MDPLMQYCCWEVNERYRMYAMVGLGVECSVDKTYYISLQAANIDDVILGLGFWGNKI